jgi:prephenate dehydrogenase
MTSTPPESRQIVAVLGTGLMGTSIALAASRAGFAVRGWDVDAATSARAAAVGGFDLAGGLSEAVRDADLVVVATPIPAIPQTVVAALAGSTTAVVTDTGSIKEGVAIEVAAQADPRSLGRFVPGHPMGGSERSGPEHASASVVDGIVWVVTPIESSAQATVDRVEAFARAVGARPVRMAPDRHDRLVAIVSHLPQVASTALMGLAATEEADEPDILLLAAGGFRDLTRLAASNPLLWSEILLANRREITRAIDLYVERLEALRQRIDEEGSDAVRASFAEAKDARLRLAAKPQVRAGVAVWQVEVPDRPGSLANLTSVLAEGGVNIEDLQIVHSPEGGRGTVHLTVGLDAVDACAGVLSAHGFDPIRLA